MSERTHTPADVRERVARELAGHRQNYDGPDWYDYEVADRIIALLRAQRGEGSISDPRALEVLDDDTLMAVAQYADDLLHRRGLPCVECHRAGSTPRGEGDVKPLAWRVEYRGRTGGEWEYLNTYDLVEVAKEKVERMRRGGVRLEYRIVPLYPAALRSEAQGEEV